VRICRQTPRHSEQTFADGAVTTARFAIRALPQKEHLPLASDAAIIIECSLIRADPFNVCSAAVTHELQIKTFGPAISRSTISAEWPQKLHDSPRVALRERQTRLHQLPPAASTICWTR
jgi:hypothetical protein